MRPLVEDAAAPWRDATFSEFNGDHGRAYPTRAMVDERYKYIHHFSGDDEMYDVIDDPLEECNLIHEEAHAARAAAMRQGIRDWMHDTGDLLDMDEHADFHPSMWREFKRDCRA